MVVADKVKTLVVILAKKDMGKVKKVKQVSDVSKEQQTDELKILLMKQIKQFVFKYQKRYYPQFDGDLNGLAADIFADFLKPKKHRNGEVFSELDRIDPAKVGNGKWTGSVEKAMATYTQRFVMHSLIDYARGDKGEVRADENYDEASRRATLDRLKNGKGNRNIDGEEVGGAYQEDINYKFYDLMDNPIAISNAKRMMIAEPSQVGYILYLLKHYVDKLEPEVKKFIVQMIEAVYLKLPEEAQVANEKKLRAAASVLDDELKEHLLSLVPDPSEDDEDIDTSILPPNCIVENYKLQGKQALKLTPNPKEYDDKDVLEGVIGGLKKKGYTYYRSYRGNWYFFKNDK